MLNVGDMVTVMYGVGSGKTFGIIVRRKLVNRNDYDYYVNWIIGTIEHSEWLSSDDIKKVS